MVNILVIGHGNVGKKTFFHLFSEYVSNKQCDQDLTKFNFDIIKIDINYDTNVPKISQKDDKEISLDRIVFREIETGKAHTIFSPRLSSKRAIIKMSTITLSRIADLIIPIFALDQDIDSQIKYFDEIKFFNKKMYICLNKSDLLEESEVKQDNKTEIMKGQILNFFRKKKNFKIIDFIITLKEDPDSFTKLFEFILNFVRRRKKRRRIPSKKSEERIKKEVKFFEKELSPYVNDMNEITFASRDIKKDLSTLKIIIEGGGGAGNTTMLKRFIEGTFNADTKMTIGIEFFVAKLHAFDQDINVQFWDFAGQQRWDSFQPYFYEGTDSMMIVFDLTRSNTIDNIVEIIESVKKSGVDPQKILLVGNKSDLSDLIQIDDNYALDLIAKYNLFSYIKTSAKTGFNIEYAFKLVMQMAMFNKNLIRKEELESFLDKIEYEKVIIEPIKTRRTRETRKVDYKSKLSKIEEQQKEIVPIFNNFEEIIEKKVKESLIPYKEIINNQLIELKRIRYLIMILTSIIFILLIIILSTVS